MRAEKTASLRLLPRLLLVFLLVLSPLYIIGVQINRSGSTNMEREIAKSLTSRAELYMEMLDGDFESIQMSLQDFVNAEDAIQLALASDMLSASDRTASIQRIKERLDVLLRANGIAEEATLSIPDLRHTISSNRGGVAPLDEDMLQALAAADASPLAVRDGRLYLTLRYPAAASGARPLFVAAAEISRDRLAELLARFAGGSGAALLTARRSDWSVSASGGSSGPAVSDPAALLAAVPEAGIADAKIGGERYMAVRQESRLFDISLAMLAPERDVNPALRTHKRWLAVLSAASVLVVLAFAYSLYRMIHRPLLSLLTSFRRMEQGALEQNVVYRRRDEFGYLYEQFNAMSKRLNVLVHEVYEQQYRLQLSELRHLQSQINPHFLYNTYFILYRMAELEEHDNVMRLTRHLGDYFQYITRDGSDEVELGREAAHARTYADIQSMRFGSRISVRFDDTPPDIERMPLPRLLLQPIIENAYKYALEPRMRDGRLHVAFLSDAYGVTIAVDDNGEGLDEEDLVRLQARLGSPDATESTGMINVHRRLQIKYGTDAGLRLRRSSLGGLRVEIVVPKLDRGDEPHDITADRGR
ncbi:histidine kinase [Cohnella sp. GCM10012308]|uniref:sensor histidine kinase n=1 Tax=Cohnella sp. GCM10012308 TaxID=3317329 RepID=UPI00361D31D6